MFKTAKTHRISENIVYQIRQAILKGELKPGDRLPPEKELAENFCVSKASLREAFRALEALGLLEVRQGVSGGAFIREVDLKTVRDNIVNYIFFQNPSIREFTQVRRIFEPEVAKIAAQNVTGGDLAELENNLIETKNDLDSGNFSYELDIFFHKKIAYIANNTLISLIIDSMQNALVNIKQLLQPDYDFSIQVYSAHKRIFEAIRDHDPEKAGAEMIKHINEVEKGLAALCESEIPLVKPG
ncbi:MAG: FadR family transcriptional regulator [Desulfobacterales bacterium]|nr:FadR family transcriptional regulator [Desulfobacterales bacterium]